MQRIIRGIGIVGVLWIRAQVGEPLKDSLLVENERIESFELGQRSIPPFPSIERPVWRIEEPSWEGAPSLSFSRPFVLSPGKPVWYKIPPLHVRYALGRFWTHLLEASWGHSRDLEKDGGIAFTHHSTSQGHVPAARWGYTYLQGWIGYTKPNYTLEFRYRGGYEKFVYYAPYAEGWIVADHKKPTIADTLKGHYWRQELSIQGALKKGGSLNLTTRRLDLHRGAPEWQGMLILHAPTYDFFSLGKAHLQLSGFIEGSRWVLSTKSAVERNTSPWLIRIGITGALGRDSLLRFLVSPLIRIVYQGGPSLLRPFIENKGELFPITYFTASEQNLYLYRAPAVLAITREWFHSQVGLEGQGKGWEYKVAGEYRYIRSFPLYIPRRPFFELSTLDQVQSVGALITCMYTPMIVGPFGEFRAAYRWWRLPTGRTLYAISPLEAILRVGYQKEDKLAFSLSTYTIGPRFLDDSLEAAPYVDISWEFHIRVWRFLSLFAHMNNLLNQTYYRWYGYRERPWDIRLGLWLKMG
ncbi:MAG: hypothetical protein RMJ66_00010 [Bacteroidia bacterium]|nr:hypothetical protein [Bacteroidia bacterium]MDW8133428.1 hypothetical protein [Bacteroidia bacterium]